MRRVLPGSEGRRSAPQRERSGNTQHQGYTAAAVDAFFGWLSAAPLPPLSDWFGLIYFDTLILTYGGVFFIVWMVRQRAEIHLAAAAETDPLTSVLLRGAFMDRAAASLARCQARKMPWSLASFDLDGFKSINDLMDMRPVTRSSGNSQQPAVDVSERRIWLAEWVAKNSRSRFPAAV
jgi:hypothetical protein